MRTPPTVEKLRVTVPVTPEVLDTFQRLAKAAGTSTGRSMGDWLGDTLDAAQFMAQTLEKARSAPKLVAQEMHAYALGLGEETGELLRSLREKGRADRTPTSATAPASGRTARTTPPSNTGVTTKKKKPGRGVS